MRFLLLILLLPVVAFGQYRATRPYNTDTVYPEGRGFRGHHINNTKVLPTTTPFDPNSDGKLVAWYDVTETGTITKDGSNKVSKWADKSDNTHDLVQASGGAQPTYSADGILFDGDADYLQVGPFAAVSLPITVYVVMKQVTWTGEDKILQLYDINQGIMKQVTSSPYIIEGTDWYTNTLATNTLGIITIAAKASGSFGKINNGANITGANTNYTGTLTYFAIGGQTGGGTTSNIQVKEIIIRSNADDATKITEINEYLATKYGIAL